MRLCDQCFRETGGVSQHEVPERPDPTKCPRCGGDVSHIVGLVDEDEEPEKKRRRDWPELP